MTDNEMLPDDLEKMITEAEMEGQIEDAQPVDTIPPVDSVEAAAESPEGKKELSKARQIFRRILTWLVLAAIAFAGGFFVDTIVRYRPEKALVEQLVVDLEESASEITSLQDEIEKLSLYKDKNTALEEEIHDKLIHLTLLSARIAVSDARLALEQDRPADGKLALDKLGSTLEALISLVSADQAEVVDTMIQRLELIMVELDEDEVSAQTDLQVLASRLDALENTLFVAP